jgi:hypothetical protein
VKVSFANRSVLETDLRAADIEEPALATVVWLASRTAQLARRPLTARFRQKPSYAAFGAGAQADPALRSALAR